MAFIAGFMLIDAPASALNNAGTMEGARTGNIVAVKSIRTRQGVFPYVSAQAFRNWLRTTLQETPELGWKASPVLREAKIAYPDANPIDYWDDDLFGYMRAPGARADQKAVRDERLAKATMTETKTEITRVSPLRVGTIVSIAPVTPTDDFGVMSRQDGDPVPHEHQFYRTVLKGLFSLDLRSCGTFLYKDKAGYRNLDEIRVERARSEKLEEMPEAKAFRLPLGERTKRIGALLRGMAVISGGAKLALHYTDVTPVVIFAAVIRGGNNPFHYLIEADARGLPRVNADAFHESLRVWGDQLLSGLYVGWVAGFHDAQATAMNDLLAEAAKGKVGANPVQSTTGHPRMVLETLASDIEKKAAAQGWME
ncbi:MAG: type I-B CRISPR-associated protein Cas7/Cst2/DevR [Bacillota bacterium]|nr:MAG: type I-B CRISPR-associated protein Cas7/Cst2/DevR [Bacillota bacterium]